MSSCRASHPLFSRLLLALFLLAALPHCSGQDQQDSAKAARAILDSIKPLISNGQFDEALNKLRGSFDSIVQTKDGDMVVEACLYLGFADLMAGDEREAQKAYETAVTLLEKAGANDTIVTQLRAAALVAEKKNRHDARIRLLQMLADTYGRMSNPQAQAETISELLEAFDKTTELHAICDTLENQLMPLYQKLNDQAGLAASWLGIGECRKSAGDIPGAIANERKSIDAFRTLGDKSDLATALDETAEMLRTHGSAAEALPLQKEAVSLRKDLNAPRDYAKSLNDLAMTDQQLGYLPDAVTAIEECVRITRTVNDPDALATSLTNQAAVYRDVGRIDEAFSSLKESLRIAHDNCLTDDSKTAMKIQGTVYAAAGDTVNAMAAEAVASDTTDICPDKKLGPKGEIPWHGFEPGKARAIPAALVWTRRSFDPLPAFQAQSPSQSDHSWIIINEKTPAQEVNTLLESAAEMLKDKKVEDAIETLRKALPLAEKSGDKTLLAAACVWMGNAQLQDNLEAEGQNSIDRGLGLLEGAGDSDDAMQALQMAIDLGREHNLPATQSKYLIELAAMKRDGGDLDAAAAKLDEALQVARAACLTSQARNVLNELVTVDSAMGKAGKAAEDRALAGDTKDICAGKPDQAAANSDEPAYMTTHNMSLELVRMGAYPKAIENFKAELKRAQGDHDPAAIVSAQEGLGYAYADSGQFTLAESALVEAQRIELGLGNPRNLARIQTDLASVYIRMGRYYDALDIYGQVEKSAASLLDIQLQINTLLTTADLYRRLKSYDQAYDDAQNALDLTRKTGFRDLAGTAQQTMGLVELARENYPEAERLFLESAKNEPDNHVLNEGLVEVYLGAGRYEEAEKELSRASDQILAGASSEYRLQYYTQRGIARLGLGLNRYTDAIDDFNSAIREAEQLRTQVVGGKSAGFLDAGSFGGRVRPYRGMVEAFATLAALDIPVKAAIGENQTDAAHAAFHFAELSRGRSLSEKMTVSRIDEIRKQVPQPLLDEEKELSGQAVQLAREHNQAHPENPATPAESEELATLQARMRAYLDTLEERYPLYARVFTPGTIPVEELPLAKGEALLEYAIGLDHVFLLVVSSDHALHCYSLSANPRQLQAQVRAFRSLIVGKRFSSAIAHDLFMSLLGSVPNYAEFPRNLIIVPDGFLALLPFEALNTASAGDPRFLALDHSIIYAQSASVLTLTRRFKRPPARKPLFALADPIFASSDPRLVPAQANVAGDSQAATPDSSPPAVTFRRLSETQAEVKMVASIIGIQPRPPDLLLGPSATKDTVLKTDLAAYRILHFATHAAALGEPGRVNEPFLVLNQVGNPPGDNGLLTMSEIMDLKLNSDLVVLSACDTGAGDILEGDGVASLASAFQFAGAESVVLSLWELPSAATLPFMRAFYQELKQGRSKAEAFAAGREAMRHEYPDPYYWAVFALYSGAVS